jgi:hypothetical protein
VRGVKIFHENTFIDFFVHIVSWLVIYFRAAFLAKSISLAYKMYSLCPTKHVESLSNFECI